ncbi:MAG: DEAD/DEAH box helicase [Actinomycetia bacterium]|nr:DEAD/DEAH box helicase [Actinomycetes bacterium]MCP4083753.1 DEAD/DEAH box helicase [Actinomycetes bacterium]
MGRATPRQRLLDRYDFEPDRFQHEAFDALDRDHNVLVAAPTGSGKTVVADYAVELALDRGVRLFYTTPIKALSNQKYRELVQVHGSGRVGLLTGDNSINGNADLVVMTTEVLRNMIYASSSALNTLGYVVLDEVHYLQDTWRGPVWEEVIIHAPPEVSLVCLSATVSNAGELAEWITDARGRCDVVVETERPVELRNLYMVGDRTSEQLHLVPTLVEGRPNREADRFDGESGAGGRRGRRQGGGGRRRWYTPRRVPVIELLDDEDLLPAITFIFSRAGCDDAVKACLDAGLCLTDNRERDRIREIVAERLGGLDRTDLRVLGHDRFIAGLDNGVAAHHAGMVPAFKETVEACFTEGLVKAVFATETLALGINMPARSVVIEKLSKFTGETHETLTPGEYTQLTGRAGRRGIDDIGHAIVLWTPWTSFGEVAGLAASRNFALKSAFKPSYNMAANLVLRYDEPLARDLLSRSFAQFQSDRDLSELEHRRDQRKADLDKRRESARSPFGDIEEFDELARQMQPHPSAPAVDEIIDSVSRLKPGDIVRLDGHPRDGRVAVLSVANRGRIMRLKGIDAGGRLVSLSSDDLEQPLVPAGQIELPRPFAPNRRSFQNEVVDSLHRSRLRGRTRRGPDHQARTVPDIDHPVADDPDLHQRLRALDRQRRLERDVADLDHRLEQRRDAIVRAFDEIITILRERHYLIDWDLTERGVRLTRIYHEADFLIAETIEEGLFDGLDAPSLAAVASVFVYEHRSSTPPPAPWFPSGEVRRRVTRIEKLHKAMSRRERAAGLDVTRAPDAGFAALAHGWAAGAGLATVLDDEEVTAGDFVRVVKQLVDLLKQLGELAPDPATARAARQAADRLHRDVVAASSVVSAGLDDNEDHDDGGSAPAANR